MDVSVDFITKSLLVAERNVILMVYDRLLKMVYFIATIKETSAKGSARLCGSGLLESVILD